MTEKPLMLVAQITDAERSELKRIAKSKGMTLGGLVAQMVRSEIRNPSGTVVDPAISGEIRGSVTL